MSKSKENNGFVCFWCDESGATLKKKVNGKTIYFHKNCYREFLNQDSVDEYYETHQSVDHE